MPRGHVLPDGLRIAALRGQADLTQQELASRSGYGLRTIGKIETGWPTSAATLAAIAEVLAEALRRPLELADLLRSIERDRNPPPLPVGANLVVSDHIKLLELGLASSPACRRNESTPGHHAVLFDTVRLRYIADGLDSLRFRYATNGGSVQGKSLSHSQRARWQHVPPVARQFSAEPGAGNCDLEMRLPIKRARRGSHDSESSGLHRWLFASRSAMVGRPRGISHRLFDDSCSVSGRAALSNVAWRAQTLCRHGLGSGRSDAGGVDPRTIGILADRSRYAPAPSIVWNGRVSWAAV